MSHLSRLEYAAPSTDTYFHSSARLITRQSRYPAAETTTETDDTCGLSSVLFAASSSPNRHPAVSSPECTVTVAPPPTGTSL